MAVIKGSGFVPKPPVRPPTYTRSVRRRLNAVSAYNLLPEETQQALTPEAAQRAKTTMVVPTGKNLVPGVAGRYIAPPSALGLLDRMLVPTSQSSQGTIYTYPLRGYSPQSIQDVVGHEFLHAADFTQNRELSRALGQSMTPANKTEAYTRYYGEAPKLRLPRNLVELYRLVDAVMGIRNEEAFATLGGRGPSNVPENLRERYQKVYR